MLRLCYFFFLLSLSNDIEIKAKELEVISKSFNVNLSASEGGEDGSERETLFAFFMDYSVGI